MNNNNNNNNVHRYTQLCIRYHNIAHSERMKAELITFIKCL